MDIKRVGVRRERKVSAREKGQMNFSSSSSSSSRYLKVSLYLYPSLSLSLFSRTKGSGICNDTAVRHRNN